MEMTFNRLHGREIFFIVPSLVVRQWPTAERLA
jgi:hypothetical protein